MRCPYCGYVDTKVTDSRESEDGIRRRRECLDCKRRFTTYERVQIAPIMIIKKDGRREEFSREKARTGIRRSCAKLPVGSADIDAIVDDIESVLHASGSAEVPSSELGDLVMERLRELSHVAYVRYASHYKDFRTLEDFQEEFERLATAPRRSPRRAGAAQPSLLPPEAIEDNAAGPAAQVESATPAAPAAQVESATPAAPIDLEKRRPRRARS